MNRETLKKELTKHTKTGEEIKDKIIFLTQCLAYFYTNEPIYKQTIDTILSETEKYIKLI